MAFFSKMEHFERNLQTNNSAEFVERMVKVKSELRVFRVGMRVIANVIIHAFIRAFARIAASMGSSVF